MNCKEVNSNLIFYIEDELQPDKKTEIKEHLQSCQDCNKLFLDIKETFTIIEKEKKIKPNPFLFTRIQQQISNLEEQKSSSVLQPNFIKILQPVTLSLLLLSGIVFGIFLGSSFQKQEQNQTIVHQTDEFYLNDFQLEKIETFLLTEE